MRMFGPSPERLDGDTGLRAGSLRNPPEGVFVILPQPYSHEDFVRNPGKYLLFRSARIAVPLPWIPHLSVGDFVNVRYF